MRNKVNTVVYYCIWKGDIKCTIRRRELARQQYSRHLSVREQMKYVNSLIIQKTRPDAGQALIKISGKASLFQ